MSEKVNFQTKIFAKDTELSYIMIKGYKRHKHERQKLIELKKTEKF